MSNCKFQTVAHPDKGTLPLDWIVSIQITFTYHCPGRGMDFEYCLILLDKQAVD